MRISDFTIPEIEYFKSRCNFTDDEALFFDYRNENLTLEKVAELMGISLSTANRLSRKVKRKILKVL